MCNRYAFTAALAQLNKRLAELELQLKTTPATGNLPAFENIYADQDGPVLVSDRPGTLTLDMMRWGFPPPPNSKQPITNIRNLKSRWWKDVNREWMTEPAYRALVPFTAFSEPHKTTKAWHWFRVPQAEIAFFAGMWRPWHGERLMPVEGKARRQRIEGDFRLYSFLTTEPNNVIEPIHEKAMPVILWQPEDCQKWLEGVPASELQRPLPDNELVLVEPSL